MILIFTDLDGSLLDHHTYSFAPASEALARVKELGIPLILCSSKTKEEMVLCLKRLGILFPFIAENGGGIYFPREFGGLRLENAAEEQGFLVLEPGVKRPLLIDAVREVGKKTGVRIRSFIEMSVEEVMVLTSLPEAEARLAMGRRFTEPFLIHKKDTERSQEMIDELVRRGFQVVKGGRFFHLMGKSGKGDAVRRVIDIFAGSFGKAVESLGLGDSENDLSMLMAVDRPVLIRKPDGSWIKGPGTEGFFRTEGIGPSGWNEAVLKFLVEKDRAGV